MKAFTLCLSCTFWKDVHKKLDGFNILGTNCWHQHVKCYELHQVMWQNDIDFIHVFNKFQTITQTIEDISYINNICLKPTPLDNVLLYLFYINVKPNAHNNNLLIEHLVKHLILCTKHLIWYMSNPFQVISTTKWNRRITYWTIIEEKHISQIMCR
jgi:hypothetical protein